jgi:hypothetical protein
LKEEYRLRVFENRAWEEYLEPRETTFQEAAEGCILRSYKISLFILFDDRTRKDETRGKAEAWRR